MDNTYDLVIVGGSAAATAAGIYAARRNLKFKIISKDFGGEVATSGEVGNWPGVNHTDGLALAQQFKDHLAFYNVTVEEGVEVEKIMREDNGMFCISAKTEESAKMAMEKVTDGHEEAKKCDYHARAVIVATGVHPRELNVPGEKEFRNKGVSYCSVCDMPLFKGKPVAIIGGGNSALESALMAGDIAQKAYVINKNPQFKGDQILLDGVMEKKNVEILYGASTKEVVGDKFVTNVIYTDKDGHEQKLDVNGVFVHIGMVPNSYVVPEEVEKDQYKQIKVNSFCATNIPGLFAAGDVTDVPYKQIVIAAGQGCIAVLSAIDYLNKNKPKA